MISLFDATGAARAEASNPLLGRHPEMLVWV
jgi:hypothetical protein